MSLQLHVKNMTNNISLVIHCSNNITVSDLKQLIYDQNWSNELQFDQLGTYRSFR